MRSYVEDPLLVLAVVSYCPSEDLGLLGSVIYRRLSSIHIKNSICESAVNLLSIRDANFVDRGLYAFFIENLIVKSPRCFAFSSSVVLESFELL